jgi:RNA polymerase sigma-70 factor (ECF subfamily)
MSHLRKRRRFGDPVLDSSEEPREPASPIQVAEEAVDRDALTQALDALPESLRVVVVLKDVYGLSCKEIGDQIGASEGAVKVRLHRARKRLKEKLFGREAGDEV